MSPLRSFVADKPTESFKIGQPSRKRMSKAGDTPALQDNAKIRPAWAERRFATGFGRANMTRPIGFHFLRYTNHQNHSAPSAPQMAAPMKFACGLMSHSPAPMNEPVVTVPSRMR